MSTRIGRFVDEFCRPSLMAALVRVAVIGTWRGRTFLDDDLDLADVAGFIPAESDQSASLAAPATGHSVAA